MSQSGQTRNTCIKNKKTLTILFPKGVTNIEKLAFSVENYTEHEVKEPTVLN